MYRSKLEELIETRGLKKRWVAEKVGISPNTLSYLLKGESEPTLKTARRLAKLLEVNIEELWPESDNDDQ